MKWVKVPIVFTYEKTDADGKKTKDAKQLPLRLCLNPYIEIVPHPEIVGRSILVTNSGIKDVEMAADDLEAQFNA